MCMCGSCSCCSVLRVNKVVRNSIFFSFPFFLHTNMFSSYSLSSISSSLLYIVMVLAIVVVINVVAVNNFIIIMLKRMIMIYFIVLLCKNVHFFPSLFFLELLLFMLCLFTFVLKTKIYKKMLNTYILLILFLACLLDSSVQFAFCYHIVLWFCIQFLF